MKETALSIVKKLEENGYSAYLVGGSVRDELLSRAVNDFDIATNASPQAVMQVFADERVVGTGIKHGTVTIVIDHNPYEVTTFRTEGDYKDCRHPETVSFVTSLKEDLERRDFTINALAYNPKTGIIDYFGGIDDLNNKIIRAVGEPRKRFQEDALRILRAVRLSAQLGFEIEKNTLSAMKLCAKNLDFVSKERIFDELTKLICAKYAADAIYACKEIIFQIIPELSPIDGFKQQSLSHDYDVFNHTLKAIELAKKRTPTIMWTLLLHDIAKPLCFTVDEKGYGHTKGHPEVSSKISAEIADRLKFPTKLKNDVVNLVYMHDADVSKTKYQVKRFLFEYGKEFAYNLLSVKTADMLAHSDYGIKKYKVEKVNLREYLSQILNNNECYDFSALKISGSDLLKLGFKGKSVGEAKSILLDKVMREELKNDEQELLIFAKTLL